MENTIPFGELLEAADKLSPEEQETMIEIMHRRIIEHRREELFRDIQLSRQEFQEGKCEPTKPANLLKEILP